MNTIVSRVFVFTSNVGIGVNTNEKDVFWCTMRNYFGRRRFKTSYGAIRLASPKLGRK
jgi:hypothetical protein